VRLQAVSCSDPRISRRCLSMGKRGRLIRSCRDGMVYLGFANWGARSSIPDVESLDVAARKRREAGRRRRQRWERRKDRAGDGVVGRRDNVWDDGTGRRGRRRRDGRDKDDDYDDDDDGVGSGYGRYDGGRDASEDLDLADVISDVVAGNADGARRVGKALEPDVEDLEFSNPPRRALGRFFVAGRVVPSQVRQQSRRSVRGRPHRPGIAVGAHAPRGPQCRGRRSEECDGGRHRGTRG
jgi:hypothetical protein